MPTSDGEIKGSMICSQAVVERVLGDEAVTSVKIYNTLQSDNFVTGSSGWQIRRDTGSAEFQDATIRGTLNASDISAGTMSVSYLAAGTLDVSGDITVASGSDIKSSDFVTGPSGDGWQIAGDGVAEFNDVTVRGAIVAGTGSDMDWSYISNVAINNADIVDLSADKINAGTMAVTYLTGGTYSNSDITFSSGSDLISSNYSSTPGAEAGWRIDGNGDAWFNDVTVRGTIYATAGEIGGLDIDGTLTMTTGGLFITNSAGNNRIALYYSDSDPTIGFINTSNTEVGKLSMAATGNAISLEATNGNDVVVDGNTGDAYIYTSSGSTYLGGAPGAIIPTHIEVDQSNNDIGLFTGSSSSVEVLRATYNAGNEQILITAGSAADPGLSFISDDDTGMYRYGANQIGFTSAGNSAFYLMIEATNSQSQMLSYTNGQASDPSYTWHNDNDTGFYRSATNQIGVTCGGTARYYFGSSSIAPAADNTYDLGFSTTGDFQDAYVTNGVTTGSDPATKDFTDSAALSLDFVTRLDPAAWRWKQTAQGKGKRVHHGLDAGQVKDTLDKLGIDSEGFAGWVMGEDGKQRLRYHEFTGPIVAAIKELADKLTRLENAVGV